MPVEPACARCGEPAERLNGYVVCRACGRAWSEEIARELEQTALRRDWLLAKALTLDEMEHELAYLAQLPPPALNWPAPQVQQRLDLIAVQPTQRDALQDRPSALMKQRALQTLSLAKAALWGGALLLIAAALSFLAYVWNGLSAGLKGVMLLSLAGILGGTAARVRERLPALAEALGAVASVVAQATVLSAPVLLGLNVDERRYSAAVLIVAAVAGYVLTKVVPLRVWTWGAAFGGVIGLTLLSPNSKDAALVYFVGVALLGSWFAIMAHQRAVLRVAKHDAWSALFLGGSAQLVLLWCATAGFDHTPLRRGLAVLALCGLVSSASMWKGMRIRYDLAQVVFAATALTFALPRSELGLAVGALLLAIGSLFEARKAELAVHVLGGLGLLLLVSDGSAIDGWLLAACASAYLVIALRLDRIQAAVLATGSFVWAWLLLSGPQSTLEIHTAIPVLCVYLLVRWVAARCDAARRPEMRLLSQVCSLLVLLPSTLVAVFTSSGNFEPFAQLATLDVIRIIGVATLGFCFIVIGIRRQLWAVVFGSGIPVLLLIAAGLADTAVRTETLLLATMLAGLVAAFTVREEVVVAVALLGSAAWLQLAYQWGPAEVVFTPLALISTAGIIAFWRTRDRRAGTTTSFSVERFAGPLMLALVSSAGAAVRSGDASFVWLRDLTLADSLRLTVVCVGGIVGGLASLKRKQWVLIAVFASPLAVVATAGLVRPDTTAATLGALGVLAAATAWYDKRRQAVLVSGVLLAAAWLLHSIDFSPFEVRSFPVAALGAASYYAYAYLSRINVPHRIVSTWWLLPSTCAALLPSAWMVSVRQNGATLPATLALMDASTVSFPRLLLVVTMACITVVLGVRGKLAAYALGGTAALTLVSVCWAAGAVASVPAWIPFALGGAVLLAVGANAEKVSRTVRAGSGWVKELK